MTTQLIPLILGGVLMIFLVYCLGVVMSESRFIPVWLSVLFSRDNLIAMKELPHPEQANKKEWEKNKKGIVWYTNGRIKKASIDGDTEVREFGFFNRYDYLIQKHYTPFKALMEEKGFSVSFEGDSGAVLISWSGKTLDEYKGE